MSKEEEEAPAALGGRSDSWPCHNRVVALDVRVCREERG